MQYTLLKSIQVADHSVVDPHLTLIGEDDQKSTPADSGDKLLLWCNSNKERRFIVIDARTGMVHNDIPCIGRRVLCAVIVGQRVWLGTEVV